MPFNNIPSPEDGPLSKQTITGIFLALFLFIAGISLASIALSLSGLSALNVFTGSRLAIWLFLGLLWLYASRVERQPFFPWQHRRHNPVFYLLSVTALFALLIAGGVIINIIVYQLHLQQSDEKMKELVLLFRRHQPLIVFTSFTAGVVEEFVFRGYLLPRLERWFRSGTAAVIVSSVLFGLAHFGYGNVLQMIIPAFIGLVFALHYRRYRNIHIVVLCHFLWDVMVLYISVNR